MDIRTTIMIVLFFVYSTADQNKLVTGSRRSTTMENVRAIYNRFTRTSKGKASFYGEYPGGGLCFLDPPSPLARQNDWIKIAVSKEDFQKTLGCGMCVEIRGAGNPSAPDLKGTTAVSGVLKGIVFDLCGSCKQGDVDLYLPGNGVWDITMKAIDCPSLTGTVGYIQLKFTGSNEWYFKLQPRNTKIPVAGIEVFNTVTNDWYCLKRTDDNYFASEGLGKVTFPIKVRLTSITNERLETTITTLKNDEAFPSDVQFSGIQTRGGSPEGIECFGQGHKSTKDTGPEADEKFCAGKADGKYADPVDSSAYYECFEGKSYKKYCENGRKFNAMKGECDEAGNVLSYEKRDQFSRNKIVKSSEAESIEMRDDRMSPRSLKEVTKKRNTILHKRRHHHHHHHHPNGLRSYTYHRHRHWRNKTIRKQRQKIHLKATGTRIHQGFKRTPDKKLDVKVRVQFNGPNLSGEFVTKDPANPKEGKLFISTVESAEQGNETDSQLDGQKLKKNALLLKNSRPMSFSAGVPENPFRFEDDPQSHGGVGKQLNNMAGNVIVQTLDSNKPSLNIEGNATDGQVHASNVAGDLSSPLIHIQHLLKGSYQTKPKVVYLQKEVGSNDKGNSSAISGNLAGLNVTKPQKAKLNVTSSQELQSQAIQGIMEAINLVKAIKLTRNSSNIPGGMGNKSMKHELKDHRNTTKINNGENPNGSLVLNNTNSPKGGANLTLSGSNIKENLQEPIKARKEKPKSAPHLKKKEGNFGILFIVNRTKNDNKKEQQQQQQQQLSPVIGNQVNIIPDIDNKMKQITDKGSEKAGNISVADINKQVQSSDLSTPVSKGQSEGTSKDEQSKQDKVVSKKIHQSVQKAGSVAGLLGLIGDLMKTKVENKSSLLNETVDSSTAMTNGSQDCHGKCGKESIGKINISLQTVSRGESQKNSDEGSNVTHSSNASGEEQEKNNDLSNQLQVLERPRPMQQEAGLRNISATNNFGKSNESELQTSTEVGPISFQGTGSIQTTPISVPLPVMRIRLKRPYLKPQGAAQPIQDEILAPASKHRGIFINDDDNEADHKGKSLHTTTVIVRQYNKDEKHANYEAEDTLPMAGSEDFDEYGNRKMTAPMISMNEADNLLNVDKSLLDNAAIQNVLYNPSLSNSYPEQKEGNVKMNQENSLTGEAEDFANALKNQEDEPHSLQKTAAKQTESISHRAPLLNRGNRFGFHGSRIEKNEQHGSVKPQGHVVSNYGGNRLGMEKHKSYMDIDGMGDMPMEGNMAGMDQMGGSMQDMPGMGGGMQGMNGMGGGMQGMNDVGGGMQGMNDMGGGMQGMNVMGGRMQGMNGMGGRVQAMTGMGGGAQGTAGTGGGINVMSGMKGGMQGMSGGMGKGSGPVGMQVLGGSQTEINSNMNQALAGMQDMALKQIQSKYPGMQITMKADDGGEESGEEPTVSVQQGSGDNQEVAGSASPEPSPSAKPTPSEVFGKHQESKVKNIEKTEGKGKSVSNKEGDKKQQFNDNNIQQIGNNEVPNDQQAKAENESQKTEHHEMNEATSKEKGENDELVSSQSGGNIKAVTGDQKQSAKSANEGAKQNDPPSVSNKQATAKLGKPKDICRQRTSGVYTNKDDPTKFIICYNGITEERQCADGMIFNPREKVCEATAKQKENTFQDKPSKAKMKNKKINSNKSKRPKVSGKKSSSDE